MSVIIVYQESVPEMYSLVSSIYKWYRCHLLLREVDNHVREVIIDNDTRSCP